MTTPAPRRTPRVVLIGDSIRLGYQDTVRAELADAAHLWSPQDNGQHTVNVLLNAYVWIVAQQPDVLHVNAGIWDTRRIMRGEPGNIVPLEQYRDNVARLITLAHKHTPAKVIWATSTPCDTRRVVRQHRLKGWPGRDGDDIPIYNAVAVEVARSLGAQVNDLYAVALAHDVNKIRMEDGTHFTAEGYQILGSAVAKAIRPHLAH